MGRRIGIHAFGALSALVLVVAWLGASGARAAVSVFPIPTADSEPYGIVAGPDGNLWFPEENGYKLGRVAPSGQITEFPVPMSSSDTDAGEGPSHIVSSGGSLWFTDDVGEHIYSMTPSGAVSAPYSWQGSFAEGLGASDTGGIWLFDRTADPDQIQRIDPGGANTVYRTDDINQVYNPFALASNGSTWYAEGQYLVNITDAGSQVKVPIPATSASYEVTSLAYSSTGALWFTMHDEHDYSFPVGGAIGYLAPGASTPTIVENVPVTQDLAPENLVAGPGGTMYFSWSNGIGEVDGSGRVSLYTLSGYHPSGLTLGPDGALWFVDEGANSVGRIALGDPLITPTGSTGGTPSPSPSPSPSPPPSGKAPVKRAPSAKLTFPAQRLSRVRAAGRLKATCALTGAGTCVVSATLPAATARHLHLKVAKRAKTVTLAHASHTLARKGHATLTLKLSKTVRTALRRTHKVTLTMHLTSSHRGTRSRTLTRKLTLSR